MLLTDTSVPAPVFARAAVGLPPAVNPVVDYYHRTESRVGYRLFLGGTKHFGLYRPGQSKWAFRSAMRAMEDTLARSLRLPAGSRVLDAGAGMGDVASRLAGVHGFQVSGVDLLDFNVAEATRRVTRRGLTGQVSFRIGDYSELPFDASSMDGLYTMETLVHAPDPEKALAEFFRVLRPGGRLVLIEYSRQSPALMTVAANRAFARVNELSAMPAFQRFEYGVLETLIRQAGFNAVEVHDVTGQMLPMLHAFSLIARVPYTIGKHLGLSRKLVNAMSAVEFWKHRTDFRYNIYTATKPLA